MIHQLYYFPERIGKVRLHLLVTIEVESFWLVYKYLGLKTSNIFPQFLKLEVCPRVKRVK